MKIQMSLVLLLAASNISAHEHCFPSFVKEGVSYEMTFATGDKATLTVLEINEKGCWIKSSESGWVSKNAILAIRE